MDDQTAFVSMHIHVLYSFIIQTSNLYVKKFVNSTQFGTTFWPFQVDTEIFEMQIRKRIFSIANLLVQNQCNKTIEGLRLEVRESGLHCTGSDSLVICSQPGPSKAQVQSTGTSAKYRHDYLAGVTVITKTIGAQHSLPDRAVRNINPVVLCTT